MVPPIQQCIRQLTFTLTRLTVKAIHVHIMRMCELQCLQIDDIEIYALIIRTPV